MPLNIHKRPSPIVFFEAKNNGGAWQNASFSEFNDILDPMVSDRNAGSTGDDEAVSEDEVSEAVPENSDHVDGGDDIDYGDESEDDAAGQGLGDDSPVSRLVYDEKVTFQRDTRGEGDDAEEGIVEAVVTDLYKNDPEFKEAFEKTLKKGLRVFFRFNADENRATVVNGNMLMVDIKGDADIKLELKRVFNENSMFKVVEPGEGLTLEEVMADGDMSPADYVGHLERLGIFSFSGPHAGKLRKDVIFMLEKSPFMRKMVQKGIEKHIEDTGKPRKYSFATMGDGGSGGQAFDDLGTILRGVGDSYSSVSNEDYRAEDQDNLRLLSHEMMHVFMRIYDAPVIDVSGEIFARDFYGDDRTYSDAAHITYDDELKGTPWALDDDFDTDAFLEAAANGELNDLSHQEIFDRFGGASVGSAPTIADDDEYDDRLNTLVEAIRSSVDVDGRKTSHIDGALADQYSQLLDYNMSSGDFDNWREAGEYTKKAFMARLGNFGPEAAVFRDYLEKDGGNEQLDDLAFVAWNYIMSPGYDAISSVGEADDVLNTIVSTIERNVDVEARNTLIMKGDLADDYKRLLEYNLRHGDFEDFEDLSEFTRDQFLDRLGNFPEEAEIFEGYLEELGGNETLDSLAETVWNDFYVAYTPKDGAPDHEGDLWPLR